MHQTVVYVTNIVGRKYVYAFLLDYVAGVDFVFQEERGDAGLCVPIHYSPVDRCGSSVAREEGRVKVESPHRRHGPYYFRKHAESYHNKQVGFQGLQFVNEDLIL